MIIVPIFIPLNIFKSEETECPKGYMKRDGMLIKLPQDPDFDERPFRWKYDTSGKFYKEYMRGLNVHT